MNKIRNGLIQVAHLCSAITIGICIAYIDLSAKPLIIIAVFTGLLYLAYGYLEELEIRKSRNPIAERAARKTGFDLSTLDKMDRGE